MNRRRGSILLYTLSLFMSVILFLECILIQRFQDHQRQMNIMSVVRRLDLQELTLATYRDDCDFTNDDASWDEDEEEHDDEAGDENLLCTVSFSFEGEVYVIEGDRFVFELRNEHGVVLIKYDIMEDGSVIETMTEEII